MKEKIIIGFATFILGACFNHVWDKFRKRTLLLKYTVWHYPLGTSGHDPRFGSVKLLYNDNPVNNLFMSTILLSNENNKDLTNLELNIVCDQESMIIISHGRNKSSLNDLTFTDKYTQVLVSNKPESLGYIITRRDYKIPVLNRGDKIDIVLLTTNRQGKQPVLTVSCDYPGVRIKYAQVYQELFGEPLPQSALLGSLIALLLCGPIIFFVGNKTIAIWVAVVLGLFASMLGVVVRKACKFIVKMLS